ncbi:MAG: ABC transporter substrate-binding protein [Leptolyngbyaceae cyanobacterium SM1_1_3]|nr:ABC transporter substrate-binding protein [Leptolyngbyaceae cyanobacterium SM1_1_3]NJM84830.1 ABC transporter substrate-binding protein [Leptolyngbyaceae cyanobacterium RM2_2_21]NJN03643.1 ABC transporter substrate-binding protein [Leptolyngbyaceae cyanobacterium RM1_1_2]NJO10101.1 ABC transporter substrate-binding protein [Leptolyngbyaceae cyanobacterium SL_1_1]
MIGNYHSLHSTGLTRRRFIHYGSAAVGTGLLAACAGNNQTASAPGEMSTADSAAALTPVAFGTNWYAQAEHGGFYQAVATGIYSDYGLDVTIKMGGPQVNGTQLLMGKAIDFFMGFGSDAINAVQEGIPKVTVAAIFQKDPQVLLAHPDQGIETLEDLKGRPVFISASANVTYWPLLTAKYGFTEDMKRPYNFNPGPFLADKNSAQQGYLSSEPLAIEKEGGFAPVVFLLADYGYDPYSTTVETRKEIVEQDPDLVRRFVEASIKGWYSYFEDPAPGNELIKQDNPEMTDEQIAYGIEKMQEYGIVISGDAETKGIGAMTDERWKSYFDTLVEAGIISAETDYKDAYTLEFVNQGADAYKG